MSLLVQALRVGVVGFAVLKTVDSLRDALNELRSKKIKKTEDLMVCGKSTRLRNPSKEKVKVKKRERKIPQKALVENSSLALKEESSLALKEESSLTGKTDSSSAAGTQQVQKDEGVEGKRAQQQAVEEKKKEEEGLLEEQLEAHAVRVLYPEVVRALQQTLVRWRGSGGGAAELAECSSAIIDAVPFLHLLMQAVKDTLKETPGQLAMLVFLAPSAPANDTSAAAAHLPFMLLADTPQFKSVVSLALVELSSSSSSLLSPALLAATPASITTSTLDLQGEDVMARVNSAGLLAPEACPEGPLLVVGSRLAQAQTQLLTQVFNHNPKVRGLRLQPVVQAGEADWIESVFCTISTPSKQLKRSPFKQNTGSNTYIVAQREAPVETPSSPSPTAESGDSTTPHMHGNASKIANAPISPVTSIQSSSSPCSFTAKISKPNFQSPPSKVPFSSASKASVSSPASSVSITSKTPQASPYMLKSSVPLMIGSPLHDFTIAGGQIEESCSNTIRSGKRLAFGASAINNAFKN